MTSPAKIFVASCLCVSLLPACTKKPFIYQGIAKPPKATVAKTASQKGRPFKLYSLGWTWFTKSKSTSSYLAVENPKTGDKVTLWHTTEGNNEVSLPNTIATMNALTDLGAQTAGVDTAKSADAVKTTRITEGAKVKITESNNAVEALKHAPVE